MNEKDVLEMLASVGAVLVNSHFVYTSGKHGSAYVNKDAIYPYTKKVSGLCYDLAAPFCILEQMVDVVVVPAVGGINLLQWTAHHLSNMQDNEVLAVYAEKSADGETFVLNRGYAELVKDKQVLVVEDVLNTGGSARTEAG